MRSPGIAVLLALAAAALAGCTKAGTPAAQPTPPPATTTSSAAVTTSAPPPATTGAPAGQLVLGPNGVGALRLKMTKSEAQATGLTTNTTTTGIGSCGGPGDGYLFGTPKPDGEGIPGRLFFSASTGKLVAIYAYPGVTTPKGIGLGSTYAQLHAAYPGWQGHFGGADTTNGRGFANVPGNADAHYRIVVQNHQVVEISLDANDQGCYE